MGGDGSASATGRGVDLCRGCSGGSLVSVLDLGEQPLANDFPRTPGTLEPRFPLHLRACPSCGLGQVGEYVLPERIFSDYPYLSSMSESWVEHARNFADRQTTRLGLNGESWVLEIASNDGYLLREFSSRGVGVLGVEPADNVSAIAQARGVETLTAFFSAELAVQIREKRGTPSLIAANNVMAHVPDMDDFVRGLAALCDDQTLVSVENPTLMNLLTMGQFDTIYHEHFSYLSAHAMARIVERHGLSLLDIEALPTHGGSNRYWLGAAGRHKIRPAVAAAIAAELERGLLSLPLYREFAEECRETISGLQSWLSERSLAGSRVVVYGAAAKGNTLLNAAGVDSSIIHSAVDASPEKQGRFLPGSGIPILPREDLPDLAPDEILLLPWNIQGEVAAFVGQTCPGARLWIAVPRMEIIPT